MKDAGYIDLPTYIEAVDTTLELKAGQITRRSAIRSFHYRARASDREVRRADVRGGGLKVYTTINPRFQKLAVRQCGKRSASRATRPRRSSRSTPGRCNSGDGLGRPRSQDRRFNLPVQGSDSRGRPSRRSCWSRPCARGSTRSRRAISRRRSTGARPELGGLDLATYSHSYLAPCDPSATLSSDNTGTPRLTSTTAPRTSVRTPHG